MLISNMRRLSESKNNVDNLEALRQKTADMMVTDLIEGVYYENKEPGVFCVATDKPFPGTASFKSLYDEQR